MLHDALTWKQGDTNVSETQFLTGRTLYLSNNASSDVAGCAFTCHCGQPGCSCPSSHFHGQRDSYGCTIGKMAVTQLLTMFVPDECFSGSPECLTALETALSAIAFVDIACVAMTAGVAVYVQLIAVTAFLFAKLMLLMWHQRFC